MALMDSIFTGKVLNFTLQVLLTNFKNVWWPKVEEILSVMVGES